MELADTSTIGDPSEGGEGAVDGEGEGQGQQGQGLKQQLTQIDEKAIEGRIMAKLMVQHPEVAAVLRSKLSGRKVRVVDQDDQSESALQHQGQDKGQQAEPDFDTMTEKQKLEWLGNNILSQLSGTVKGLLKPVEDKLGTYDQYIQRSEGSRIEQEVNQLRAKYPDFNKFSDKMLELSNQHPTLSAKQLYTMAKADAGEQVVERARINSEQPSMTSARPSGVPSRQKPIPAGVAGLRAAIRGSAGKLREQYSDKDFMSSPTMDDDDGD